MHGKRILKLLQKIFSWLPLATVIDQKVLVLHGGISDSTDLSVLARVDRHNVRKDHMSVINRPHFHFVSFLVRQVLRQSMFFFQYVSALRPPKKRHQSLAGMSIDSDMDYDWSNNKAYQRRASLTFPKPLGTRNTFQNRSLQDFSDRLKVNAEDEVESHGRKASVSVGVNKLENEVGQSASSDSINSDNNKDEWKQVRMNMQQGCSLSRIFIPLTRWEDG